MLSVIIVFDMYLCGCHYKTSFTLYLELQDYFDCCFSNNMFLSPSIKL